MRRRMVYRGEVYNALESARVNALDGILSDPYKEGFHDGIKRAIQILANEVDDAPTVIEVEEIPPHGRLVDADELFKGMERKGWFDNADRDIAEDLVLAAPTIIQEEEGE